MCDKPYGGWFRCDRGPPPPSVDVIIVGEWREGEDISFVCDMDESFVWLIGDNSGCLTLSMWMGDSGASACAWILIGLFGDLEVIA